MAGSFFDRVKDALHLEPNLEKQDEAMQLIDAACDAIEEVRREREALNKALRRRPDLAEALLRARDRSPE